MAGPGDTRNGQLTPLVKPYPVEDMELYPVGFGVNSPKHEGEGLIKRPQEIASTRLFLQRFIQIMQCVQQAIEDAATRALAPYRIVQLPAHVVASVLCPASRFFAAFTTIEFRLDRFFGCHGILTILLVQQMLIRQSTMNKRYYSNPLQQEFEIPIGRLFRFEQGIT